MAAYSPQGCPRWGQRRGPTPAEKTAAEHRQRALQAWWPPCGWTSLRAIAWTLTLDPGQTEEQVQRRMGAHMGRRVTATELHGVLRVIPDIFHLYNGKIFLSWPKWHGPECRGEGCGCPILHVMPAPGANLAAEAPWPQEDEQGDVEETARGAPAVDDEADMPWYDWPTGRPPWLEEEEGWVADDQE